MPSGTLVIYNLVCIVIPVILRPQMLSLLHRFHIARRPWWLQQQVLCCGQTSAKVGIMGRFVTFFHSLRNSASREVQILSRLFARDIRSTCGRNLQYIREVTGLDPWTAPLGRLKAALAAQETVEVDAQDRWRISYLWSLLSQRGEAHYLAQDDQVERLTDLIN